MLVRLPAAVFAATRATTVIVRVALMLSVPNWHTVPPHTPLLLALMRSSVMPAGSASLMSTLRARPAPVLVMVTV